MVIMILGLWLGFIYITTASWPLYVDLAVFGLMVLGSVPYVAMLGRDTTCRGVLAGKCLTGAFAGIVVFIIMYFWCGLTISVWWYFLALVIGIAVSFIPGGFTIASFVVKSMGLIPEIPAWLLIVTIAIDLICIIMYVQAFGLRRHR